MPPLLIDRMTRFTRNGFAMVAHRTTYIFGSLPDTIEDDWIDDIETMNEKLSEFIGKRKAAQSAFDLRYGDTIDPEGAPWARSSLAEIWRRPSPEAGEPVSEAWS